MYISYYQCDNLYMQNFTVELVKRIADYTISQQGDHFSIFAVNRTFASAVAPAAKEWTQDFEADDKIRDEIEREREERDQNQRDGHQYIDTLDIDSSDSGSVDSDFQSYEFWARWAGEE